MTQLALQRLLDAHIPQIVYIPHQRRISGNTCQRSVDQYVGYRALWLKVIIRAAFDWVQYRDSSKLEKRKDAESGYKWIFEPSELDNSFENICKMIDLPPENLRTWAKTLTKEHVAKIEHLEREGRSGALALAVAERNLIESCGEVDE